MPQKISKCIVPKFVTSITAPISCLDLISYMYSSAISESVSFNKLFSVVIAAVVDVNELEALLLVKAFDF